MEIRLLRHQLHLGEHLVTTWSASHGGHSPLRHRYGTCSSCRMVGNCAPLSPLREMNTGRVLKPYTNRLSDNVGASIKVLLMDQYPPKHLNGHEASKATIVRKHFVELWHNGHRLSVLKCLAHATRLESVLGDSSSVDSTRPKSALCTMSWSFRGRLPHLAFVMAE
jgi:hypothetical protein